jgi:hypothetical protein
MRRVATSAPGILVAICSAMLGPPSVVRPLGPDNRAMLIVSVRRPGAEPTALTGALGPTFRGRDR